MDKPRKVPMRMCVGCRQMQPKRQLIRLVRRAEDGSVVADRTGKASGRGAYICANLDCLQRARKTRQFERALEVTLTDQTFEQLVIEIERRALFPN